MKNENPKNKNDCFIQIDRRSQQIGHLEVMKKAEAISKKMNNPIAYIFYSELFQELNNL